ncbi:MAG: hypothetical protein D6732_15800 [Methanobacteriota archaeon]|nr:MAG: hypothetical protein D6732_15800 [Euryarchaeota archaeon]
MFVCCCDHVFAWSTTQVITMSEFEDLSFEDDDLLVNEIKSKTPATSKTPAGKKVTVYFQSTVGPNQKQEKLVVAKDAPIRDLKYTVGQIFGLPPDEFHISHAGRTCDPDDSLDNYGVEDGDSLLLIPVSTAGK